MNQLQAMRDTVAKMDANLTGLHPSALAYIGRLDASVRPQHIRDMLKVMESGINPQDTEREFGEAKMGRWLGWAQASVVAMGLATLDDFKTINRANAG